MYLGEEPVSIAGIQDLRRDTLALHKRLEPDYGRP